MAHACTLLGTRCSSGTAAHRATSSHVVTAFCAQYSRSFTHRHCRRQARQVCSSAGSFFGQCYCGIPTCAAAMKKQRAMTKLRAVPMQAQRLLLRHAPQLLLCLRSELRQAMLRPPPRILLQRLALFSVILMPPRIHALSQPRGAPCASARLNAVRCGACVRVRYVAATHVRAVDGWGSVAADDANGTDRHAAYATRWAACVTLHCALKRYLTLCCRGAKRARVSTS